MAITGVHAMFYSDEAAELRAFLRDKLGLPARDVGGGWLIFDFGQADMGVHPTDPAKPPPSGTHDISFVTDDMHGTVAELKARGVVFDGEPVDQGFGLTVHFEMPTVGRVMLYEKRY
mgnify:CR=1 FL=1